MEKAMTDGKAMAIAEEIDKKLLEAYRLIKVLERGHDHGEAMIQGFRMLSVIGGPSGSDEVARHLLVPNNWRKERGEWRQVRFDSVEPVDFVGRRLCGDA